MADFIQIPTNPAPQDSEVFEFASHDGATLRGAFFPTANARATIVVVTGWSEFIEKYFEVVTCLQKRGLNVAMMDWRGQGLSDRQSGPATKWNGYFSTIAEDLRWFTDRHVSTRFTGAKFLMTHSMGGLPALMLLADGYDAFERAVLCAPMTRLFAQPVNAIVHALANIAGAVGLATTPITKGEDDSMAFEGNMFTTDPARHERFRQLQLAEPKAAVSAPTYGWMRAAGVASAAIHKPGFFDQLKTPIRIITAGAEKRIDASDHQTIANQHPLIEQITIPNALHEIMMESDNIQALYWQAFDAFIQPFIPTETSS